MTVVKTEGTDLNNRELVVQTKTDMEWRCPSPRGISIIITVNCEAQVPIQIFRGRRYVGHLNAA
jgi:hypothetical protein